MIFTTRGLVSRVVTIVALAVSSTAVHAQSGPAAPSAAPATQTADTVLTPLRLTVTLSRYEGEKRVSNLPFTLWVNANDGHVARLTSAQEVPIGLPALGGVAQQPRSFEYKNVGTNIVARTTSTSAGLFRVSLEISDSSVVPSKDSGEPVRLETLSASTVLLLTDGQLADFIASTDKVTGAVTRLSVTATVITHKRSYRNC